MKSNIDTQQIVVGLDIGTTKVVAVVGKYNEYGAIDVLGIGTAQSEGVERGQIVYLDKTVEAIKSAVEQASRHSNVEIALVTVGIAGEHIHSLQQKGIITLDNPEAEISPRDVERLTANMYQMNVPAGQRILHIIPQEYAVDDRKGIKDPVGISGVRLEGNFHIVTAADSAIRTIQRVCERAGLDVQGIVLESVASSYASLQPDEMLEGVALVDIGGGTTDVALWQNGVIRHTATIPFGGNVITDDIRLGCQVMKKHAETLKTNYGSALASELLEEEIISISGLPNRPAREINRRTLARIIQARMEEIAEMVSLEIRAAGMDRSLVGGIVLCGGGAYIQHCCELFEYVTGQNARIGYPTGKLSKGLVEEVSHPMYATATGLVAYSLEQTALGTDDVPMDACGRVRGLGAAPRQREGVLGGIKKFFEKAIEGSPVE
jgi:cell division protein FtsA